jgi:hypothetical protein
VIALTLMMLSYLLAAGRLTRGFGPAS